MRAYLLAALIASNLALGACADGDGGTLYVAGIVEPDEECNLPANPDLFRSSGFVNVDLASGFTLAPQLINGVIDTSGLNDSISPAAAINVIGADVSLLNVEDQLLPLVDGDGNGLANPYFVSATNSVAGNGSQSMSFTAIPGNYLTAAAEAVGLNPEANQAQTISVVLGVQMRGRTVGGDSVITPEFKYTVNLFRRNPPSCPDQVTLSCAATEDAEPVAPCPRLGQDRAAVLPPECGECRADGLGPRCFCF